MVLQLQEQDHIINVSKLAVSCEFEMYQIDKMFDMMFQVCFDEGASQIYVDKDF